MNVDPEQLREWLSVPTGELAGRSRLPVTILETTADVHRRFAQDMFDEIARAASEERPITLIVPVGPTGQYPLLAELINQSGITLGHVTFLGMDQCLDWQGRPLPVGHPLDFEHTFNSRFLAAVNADLRPPTRQVIFPAVDELDRASRLLEAQPAQTTYGGVGFRGHFAFNEPPVSPWSQVTIGQLRDSRTRILPLATDTLVALAQRQLGGNLYGVPPMAVTLGMRELLASSRIRLYTDGGAWKQTIMRVLLLGEPTVDFPITLAQDHPDVHVVLDADSATPPPAAWWSPVEASSVTA